jgi:tRNA 2-thiouridine synthesizing protein A
MAQTQAGATIVLIADDPMAQIDVPHFCTQNSYLLQSVLPFGTGWRFEIVKP